MHSHRTLYVRRVGSATRTLGVSLGSRPFGFITNSEACHTCKAGSRFSPSSIISKCR